MRTATVTNGIRNPQDDRIASSELAKPARARTWLAVGALLGWHRLYLRQVPEAFIYVSTCGLFLFGVFYDLLFVDGMVREYNDDTLQAGMVAENGEAKPSKAPAQKASCSTSRFFAQVAYGIWLGLLSAGASTIITSQSSRFLMSIMVALWVCFGVYIVGNCGKQRRPLLHIFGAAFTVSFTSLYVMRIGIARSLLFTAIAATLNGNRHARKVSPGEATFSTKYYMFWCSLFALLVCILCIGVSRGVVDRQLTVSRPTDAGAYTTTVGELVQDYVLSDPVLKRAFVPGASVHYYMVLTERRSSRQSKKAKGTGEVPDELARLWRSIMDGATLDFFDGRTDEANYEWMKVVVVYVVDYIRYDLALERIRKANPKSSTASLSEPVQWAAWRIFAINSLNADFFISDSELRQLCARQPSPARNAAPGKETANWQNVNIHRACEVLSSIAKFS